MKTEKYPKVIFIMGVSGSGKTHIGQLLAQELNLRFIDADDHHSKTNIEKMSAGIPLTDEDRYPWLDGLHQMAMKHATSGCVIACSALKAIYRERLSKSMEDNVIWIYLKGDFDLIFNRIQKRQSHFMGADMLKSQFETLEEPKNALEVNVGDAAEVIVKKIKNILK